MKWIVCDITEGRGGKAVDNTDDEDYVAYTGWKKRRRDAYNG
jgi:hypothetical protein